MSRSAMRSVAVAARGKGTANLARRARAIGARYGTSPRRMERSLASLVDVVSRFDCRATLPVTAAAAQRNPAVIARYAELGIEFAVHGHYHVDHAALSRADQVSQLGDGRRILEDLGIPAIGFRAPYLRWNQGTMEALREHGFLYDSSEAIHWPVDPVLQTDPYLRGLSFCHATAAEEHPALPRFDAGLIRIPCSLPDDEAAIDRLRLTSPNRIADIWLDILRSTHQRGELFTLAVHPERIDLCSPAIAAVLEGARDLRPGVWVARLDEIARWWSERAKATMTIRDRGTDLFEVDVHGPSGLTVLARSLDVPAGRAWDGVTRRVRSSSVHVRSHVRPVIGLHPTSPDPLKAFLIDQGFVVETTDSDQGYAVLIRRDRFSREDERPLLAELEATPSPVLRLGRWPDGAKSALAVTGDVDALTIWDYALRFVGR